MDKEAEVMIPTRQEIISPLLYMSRKESGIGLSRVEDYADVTIWGLKDNINASGFQQPLTAISN